MTGLVENTAVSDYQKMKEKKLAVADQINHTAKQCFGSGSAWIRVKIVSWVRIRIRIPNADPDPAADKISSKSQNNSYII